MQDKWYIALEGKPLGPFSRTNIENMLKARTLYFVDFIWSEKDSEWVRVFRADVFNHLMPRKPDLDPTKSKIEDINNFAPGELVNGDIGALQKGAGGSGAKAMGKVDKEKVSGTVRKFVADVIIHDNLRVYYGIVYGLSHNEIFVALRGQYLPPDRKLQIIVSSEKPGNVFTMAGRVRAMTGVGPAGYSILIDDMPPSLRKRVSAP